MCKGDYGIGIIIKAMETDSEKKGKAYVHWKSWHESYENIVSKDYLNKLTLEKCEEWAFQWPENTDVALDGDKVVGFVCYFGKGKMLRELEKLTLSMFYQIIMAPEFLRNSWM